MYESVTIWSSHTSRNYVNIIFFLSTPHGLRDLSSPTSVRTRAPALEAQSPNHWTTREFPKFFLKKREKQKNLQGSKVVRFLYNAILWPYQFLYYLVFYCSNPPVQFYRFPVFMWGLTFSFSPSVAKIYKRTMAVDQCALCVRKEITDRKSVV